MNTCFFLFQTNLIHIPVLKSCMYILVYPFDYFFFCLKMSDGKKTASYFVVLNQKTKKKKERKG